MSRPVKKTLAGKKLRFMSVPCVANSRELARARESRGRGMSLFVARLPYERGPDTCGFEEAAARCGKRHLVSTPLTVAFCVEHLNLTWES